MTVATPRLELGTLGLRDPCSIQLSYVAVQLTPPRLHPVAGSVFHGDLFFRLNPARGPSWANSPLLTPRPSHVATAP